MRALRQVRHEKKHQPSLTIFDTHPIQYRSPVFAALAKKIETSVVYFSETFEGKRWWFREYDKNPRVHFNLPLKVGFKNETLWYPTPFAFLRAVRAKMRRSDVLVVYGYYLWEHWIVLLLAKIHRIPVLFIGESFEAGVGVRHILKKLLLPLVFNSMAGIVSIGRRNAAFYRGLHVSSRRLTHARYCVDGDFFQAGNAAGRKETRQDLAIKDDAFVLLFVGRLFDRKRPLDVLEIHQQLFPRHPLIHTVFVGKGELESELRQTAANLPRVSIMGFLDQMQIRDIYYAADCLIIPSEFETWGLVANEAMHCGLPVIATDRCGVAEDLVVNGETGFVYEVGDVGKAAKAVGGLIEDKALYRRLARNCREKVADYGVEQFADAIIAAAMRVTKR